MYKSNKTYKSIQLFKEDLILLDNLLKQKFGTVINSLSTTLDTPNRTITKDSVEEVLNEFPQVINSLTIVLFKQNQSYQREQSVRVYISSYSISVTIEGEDEIWVNGMEQFLKNFFAERRSKVLALANYIPALAGGLIGLNISTFAIAIVKTNIFSAILSGILLLIGFTLANYKLMRKVFPIVRISPTSKKKMDKMEAYTVSGVIISFLGLIVSVISLWK